MEPKWIASSPLSSMRPPRLLRFLMRTSTSAVSRSASSSSTRCRPALFGTTKIFLDYFGLKRLEDLPPLSELKDIGELEPQLFMDNAPVPMGLPAADASADGDVAEDQDQPPSSGEEQNEEESELATDADQVPEDSMEANPTQEHDDTEGTDPDRLASSEQKQ